MCRHLDPFFLKEDFAPSDKATLSKEQQHASNLLAPHMRLLQFLGSHFNATLLGSPNTEKVFLRLLVIILDGLKHATGHPLTREIRLQIILFGLQVLRHSINIKSGERAILKDRILTAGLTWFNFSPRWSFGGNRLQLKAEYRLLSDVSSSLSYVKVPNHRNPIRVKSMVAKEQLLQALIDSERTRLTTWLNPLGGNAPNGAVGNKMQAEVSSLCITLERTID